MRARMFWRILSRSLLVRRNSSLTALAAIMVAAAVSTTMLNLYLEVQSKLRSEFRGYGANLILTAADGGSLPASTLNQLDAALAGRGTSVPYSYAVAHSSNGSPIVVAGIDFDKARAQNSWWSVTNWPMKDAVFLGARAASVLPAGSSVALDLEYNAKRQHFLVGSILRTGGPEDSRVYIPSQSFHEWTGLDPNTIEISAAGSEQEVLQLASQLKNSIPGAKVEPVRRILGAEANVFGKTRKALLAAVIIIIVTAILCVLATLTSSVLDRRRDFALMKALGASQRVANALFASEAAALGILGSFAGFVVGIALAAWIGRVNFHSPVAPRFEVLLPVVVGGLLITLVAAIIPISLLRGAQPAVLLKGE
jgi:putative ABC transport system permease protein